MRGWVPSDVRRLKELESENARLKNLLAEAELDKAMLKCAPGINRRPQFGVVHSGQSFSRLCRFRA